MAQRPNRMYNNAMNPSVSHDRSDESLEAKARWFQSLTLDQRMDMLCEFTDLALELRPDLVEQKRDVEPASRSVRVLELP